MKMKNFYNVWKKHLLKENKENNIEEELSMDSSTISLTPTSPPASDPTKAAADAKEQQDKQKKEIVRLKNELAIKQKQYTNFPKEIQNLKDNIEQLSKSIQSEGYVGNAAGSPSEGAVGPGAVPYSVLDEEELTEEEMEEAWGQHEGTEEGGQSCQLELEYQEMEEEKTCNECMYCRTGKLLTEAKYKGRTVPLGKPMRGDVKKFKVFVRDPKTGNVKKVNFGDKKMRIKKSNPKRRKSFRARHRCANPGPRTKARYWSCRKW
jgi:ribosomal protein L12E/L44/L45/RPP1/RPP2